jgi:uncharacterized membrane protein YGL010W
MEEIPHRQIDLLLDQYGESHRDHRNEAIHFVCIPAIVFSVLGLLWAAHPAAALLAMAASLVYYLRLSVALAFGMMLMSTAMLWLLSALPQGVVLPLAIVVFVVAWIGQFIGHKIEGRKPSFLDDLRFLLIGPLFVLGAFYRRWGISY